ncbi:MAG: hypothetical protein CSA81_05610 [Acidobacteria bacterium]|nr:MAG: hypothetical protein CSA81_05610 [Acidobacteriota bacterium]PIE90934.1 MAG: hypothetical protein CR997_03500 [Acidobacteriota bacterium]
MVVEQKTGIHVLEAVWRLFCESFSVLVLIKSQGVFYSMSKGVRMKTLRISLFFAAIAILGQQEPVVNETMTINLIELDVKVHNINGTYLSQLTVEDFKVYENGDLQEITHFEEVDLMRLPEEELEDYRSKIMILLDFQNTSFKDMRKVFDQLHAFFDTEYDGTSMIGLAINSGGIAEVLPFTTRVESIKRAIKTSEELFHKALYKDNFSKKMTADAYLYSNPVGVQGVPYNHFSSTYFTNQIEVLGQFLHYVGTYTGKKNIILITGPWGRGEQRGEEGSRNDDSVLSVRDIQTSCMFNKTSINVISLDTPDLSISKRGIRNRDVSIFDRTVELASMSSGSFKKPVNALIKSALSRTIDQIGRYYRIRYYSTIKKNKYRRVKVAVKGLNRIATSYSGYFPAVKKLDNLETNAELNLSELRNLTLKVRTDWMTWKRAGWKKINCSYAIGHRVYGLDGKLVAERVSPGGVHSKKNVFPVLHQDFNLSLREGTVPLRVQTVVTDLISGKQMVMNTFNSAVK